MLQSLVKLSVRIATKPARMVLDLLKRRVFGADPAPASPSTTPPPAPRPPAEPAGPSPFEVQVDPGQIIARMAEGEAFVFVDVRQSAELAATGVIEGALHIPTQDLPRRIAELDSGVETILYCAAGVRSLDATMFLREKGFDNAWSLGGGLPHWQADGGEVVPPL